MTASRVEELSEAAWSHAEAGRVSEAVSLFQDVLQLDPANAEAWMMTGMLAAQAGHADQALASLTRAIEIDPNYPDPYLHIARIQLAAGQADKALANARKATACDSQYAEAWMLLAELSARAGDAVTAEQAYRQVLALEPGRADVHNRLGGVLSALGRFTEAVHECRAALGIEPANPEIHANLGNVYYRQGEFIAAGEAFERALQLAPGFAGARLNLGNTLRALGEYQKAGDCYQRLLDANPGFVEAQLSLGECCLKTGEFTRALACYEAALSSTPGLLVALFNKGFVLSTLDQNAEALELFKRVLAIEPRHEDAWFNRGLAEKKLGKFAEAGDSLRQALSLSPNSQDIQLSLSLLELLRGNFSEGWRYYGARKSVRDREPIDPERLMGDLTGRKILLVKDQGLGDEIFFLRFARLLKRRGAWVSYRTDPKIKSIVARLPFLDAVLDESEIAPSVDLTLSVGDLPYLLGAADATEFSAQPPLTVLPQMRDRIRKELAQAGPGPYVGVTWWAGTKQTAKLPGDKLAYREIPIHLLADMLRAVDVTPVILQRNAEQRDLETWSDVFGRRVVDMSRLNDDLEAMLALLENLDDYVGIDNTNMHLSAGIGKPCRILVPHPPEWRMGTQGISSPWFPGFSLYRQDADGSWTSAVMQLEEDLKAGLSSRAETQN